MDDAAESAMWKRRGFSQHVLRAAVHAGIGMFDAELSHALALSDTPVQGPLSPIIE